MAAYHSFMASKNLSVMLTDLQGYSTKSASSSRSELMSLVQTHNNLLKPVIDFYNGTIVKSLGDSFLCTFESATDAAVCAIAIQIITKEYNRRLPSKDGSLIVRVAVSSGDVSIEDGDIFGEAVNLAARMEKLEEIANGGIALNEATYLLVNRQEIHAEMVGEHSFKGISQPVKVYRLDLDKQKLDQLPTRLLELVRLVVEGKEIPLLAKGAARGFGWKKILAGATAAAVIAALAFSFSGRGPNTGEEQILGYVHVAFMKNGPRIEEKDWTGPKEVFREIASEKGVITPEEVHAWAKKRGFRLPPPR